MFGSLKFLHTRVALLLHTVLVVLLSSCAHETVTVRQAQSTVSILATAAALEGVPGQPYIYLAFTLNPPSEPHFEWLLDDSVIAPRSPRSQFNITFPADGWYYLRVNLYDAESGRLAATSIIQINIRSAYPLIATAEVPGGKFMLGSDKNFYEQPVHQITISNRLAIGKMEVLQHQWRMLMGYNPSWFKGDSLPVESISWNEAVDFCNRLSVRSGLVPCYSFYDDSVVCDFTASGYRLPTEAEWEYCARGGTTTDCYAGDYLPTNDGCSPPDPALGPIAWYCANAEQITHTAGSKLSNSYGLYDMIGNVSEWCWDYYHDSYYSTSPAIDPRGPNSGAERLLRGGSFINTLFTLRVSNRGIQYPLHPSYTTGFRVVRTLP
ncbi:MAG: formylglycine-generating enzyme family protein [Ignavibacteria bacterium]|nr:formylglycine-generating enzyme family protein [Ignavibacteria bacterium]